MQHDPDRVVRALMAREGPTALFGITLDGCGPGWAMAALTVDERMLNGLGTAHGGVLFLLADTAFAWAANGRGAATVAQAASITFLRPALAGDRLVATARETAVAGRGGVWDVAVARREGDVVALFQGFGRVLDRPALPLDSGD